MIRRCAISVLALATAGTLTACSSSGGSKPSTSAPPTGGSTGATTSPAKSTSATPITQPKSVPTAVPNNKDLRKQVTETSCASIPGGWEKKGTVHNTTGKDENLKITVFFTTTTGGTVQAYGSTTVNVAAGKTENWTVSSKFRADKNTSCVLRGVGTA